MREEVKNWMRQGDADLKTAKDNIKTENFYASVLFAQQAAEKYLKAFYIATKRELIQTHNLVKLARTLQAPSSIMNASAELTPDYIGTRYPNASTGIPADHYTKKIAQKHLSFAKEVIRWVKKEMEI